MYTRVCASRWNKHGTCLWRMWSRFDRRSTWKFFFTCWYKRFSKRDWYSVWLARPTNVSTPCLWSLWAAPGSFLAYVSCSIDLQEYIIYWSAFFCIDSLDLWPKILWNAIVDAHAVLIAWTGNFRKEYKPHLKFSRRKIEAGVCALWNRFPGSLYFFLRNTPIYGRNSSAWVQIWKYVGSTNLWLWIKNSGSEICHVNIKNWARVQI